MEPFIQYFDNVKRSAMMIKIKKPFIDWLKSIDPIDENDQMLKEGDIYLLPDYEEKKQMEDWLEENFDDIFSDQLNNWIMDEELWPQLRSFKMFKDWFEYSLHTMVWDTEEDEIEKV